MISTGKSRFVGMVFFLLINLFFYYPIQGQQRGESKHKGYLGVHKVKKISYRPDSDHPKTRNVILMIGDGMGTSHVYAAMMANKGMLNLDNFPFAGFMKVYSANDAVTDSGASATAIATGKKTINGFIGLDKYEDSQRNIIEIANNKGIATGLVVTSSITHATPAAFFAHVYSRNYCEMIASQLLDVDVDVFIGGGQKNFINRMDGKNLYVELIQKGYKVATNLSDLEKVQSGKLAGLLYQNHPPGILQGRGDMLLKSTNKAIEILNQNENGFFLMVEGSQIDWGGHANDLDYIVEEMLDFDIAIGAAIEFAASDKETLVIVISDHETGGLALHGGDIARGKVDGAFTTKGHTAVMVPVFAFGPGAEEFSGIFENTDVFDKINQLLFKK